MSTKNKLNLIYCNHMFRSLAPFLTLNSQPLLPSPFKLQNFKTPNESLMNTIIQNRISNLECRQFFQNNLR